MEHSLARQFVRWFNDLGVGSWQQWGPILGVVLAWLALIFVLLFLLVRIRYRISPKHLVVTLLGIPIRRVRLDNIRNLHTQKVMFAEKWHNALMPGLDRILVIEKRRGLIKRFVITPAQRYVFKAELDRAIRARMGLEPPQTAAELTTFDRMKLPGAGA